MNTNTNIVQNEIESIHNYYNEQINYMRTQFTLEINQIKNILDQKEKQCSILSNFVQNHIINTPELKNKLMQYASQLNQNNNNIYFQQQ